MLSFVGRGNQYIQLVKVLYCKLSTISEQLPTFPHKVCGLNHQPQSSEVSVLLLLHRGLYCIVSMHESYHNLVLKSMNAINTSTYFTSQIV